MLRSVTHVHYAKKLSSALNFAQKQLDIVLRCGDSQLLIANAKWYIHQIKV